MTVTLLNTQDTYRMLQPFASVEQLNANTKAIRSLYADQMTQATYDVLDVLQSYACKFPGVCYLAKSKIADLLGITRRTVIRACNALEELGVIVQHETKRRGGDKRQSTNAIVFNEFISIETAVIPLKDTPNVTPEVTPIDTPLQTPLKAKTLITRDTGAREIESVSGQAKDETKSPLNPSDKQHLKNRLPEGWFEVAAPYAASYDDLYAITGALFKGKHGTTLRVEDHVTEFGEVLRLAWVAVKRGKVSQSKFYAYIFAGFKRTAAALQSQLDRAPILRDIAGLFDAPVASPRAESASMDAWTSLMD